MELWDFHVERTSEPNTSDVIVSFETLGEFLAYVKARQDEPSDFRVSVIVHYEKNLKWEGWNLEIYDDYRE